MSEQNDLDAPFDEWGDTLPSRRPRVSEQMRGCPFCGGTYPNVVGYHRVACPHCHANGPLATNRKGAIAAWNQRAGEAELASLRQEKNEAIGAALAVEQKCYDQAQELAKLRKLREAAQYVQETWQLDSDREVAEVPFGPACMLRDRLAACDEASAPTGDEHTK